MKMCSSFFLMIQSPMIHGIAYCSVMEEANIGARKACATAPLNQTFYRFVDGFSV